MAAYPWDIIIMRIGRRGLCRAPKSFNLCLLNSTEEEASENTSSWAIQLSFFRKWICVTPNSWLRPYVSLSEDPTYLPRVQLRLPRHGSASGMLAEARTDDMYSTLRKQCASLLRKMHGSGSGILDMIANNLIPGRMRHSLCVGGRGGRRRALPRPRNTRPSSTDDQRHQAPQQSHLRNRRGDHLVLLRRRAGVTHSAPRPPSVRPRRCG